MSNVISAMQAKRFMRKGCETFLAVILDSKKGQVVVENIPVVREFPDVFPEELPGIPLEREVDLSMEIVPGTAPDTIRGSRRTSRPTKSSGSRSRIRHQVKIGRRHKGSGTRLMSTTSLIHKTRFEPFHNCWRFRTNRQKRYRCR